MSVPEDNITKYIRNSIDYLTKKKYLIISYEEFKYNCTGISNEINKNSDYYKYDPYNTKEFMELQIILMYNIHYKYNVPIKEKVFFMDIIKTESQENKLDLDLTFITRLSRRLEKAERNKSEKIKNIIDGFINVINNDELEEMNKDMLNGINDLYTEYIIKKNYDDIFNTGSGIINGICKYIDEKVLKKEYNGGNIKEVITYYCNMKGFIPYKSNWCPQGFYTDFFIYLDRYNDVKQCSERRWNPYDEPNQNHVYRSIPSKEDLLKKFPGSEETILEKKNDLEHRYKLYQADGIKYRKENIIKTEPVKSTPEAKVQKVDNIKVDESRFERRENGIESKTVNRRSLENNIDQRIQDRMKELELLDKQYEENKRKSIDLEKYIKDLNKNIEDLNKEYKVKYDYLENFKEKSLKEQEELDKKVGELKKEFDEYQKYKKDHDNYIEKPRVVDDKRNESIRVKDEYDMSEDDIPVKFFNVSQNFHPAEFIFQQQQAQQNIPHNNFGFQQPVQQNIQTNFQQPVQQPVYQQPIQQRPVQQPIQQTVQNVQQPVYQQVNQNIFQQTTVQPNIQQTFNQQQNEQTFKPMVQQPIQPTQPIQPIQQTVHPVNPREFRTESQQKRHVKEVNMYDIFNERNKKKVNIIEKGKKGKERKKVKEENKGKKEENIETLQVADVDYFDNFYKSK